MTDTLVARLATDMVSGTSSTPPTRPAATMESAMAPRRTAAVCFAWGDGPVLSVAPAVSVVCVASESGVEGGPEAVQERLSRPISPAHTDTRHVSFRDIQTSTFPCHRVGKQTAAGDRTRTESSGFDRELSMSGKNCTSSDL